jgi:Secretion system C-terminal sorting domain
MNEGSGATTADQQVGLLNTGTLVNGTSWGVSGALPVELTSFNAFTSGGGSVHLCWQTATETNNYGFEVERLTANDRAWRRLGFVEGSGSSSVQHAYTFTDHSCTGRYAYRLKQIDRDGKFEYSSVVDVFVSTQPVSFGLIQNYPNPFNPTTNISFTVPTNGHATLKIINILGQEVSTLFNGEALAGIFNQVQFNASGHASGIYFSRLEYNGKVQMTKMTLIK